MPQSRLDHRSRLGQDAGRQPNRAADAALPARPSLASQKE